MKIKKSRGGFTLVEVIIVLVVLAILAAILIPSLSGYIDKANERAALSEAHTLVTAAQTLASEAYADGTLQTGSFLSSHGSEVLELSELTGRALLLSVSFGSGSAAISRLRCIINGYSIEYNAGGDPKYSIVEGGFAVDAAGYWQYAADTAANNSSVSGATGNDKKAKALQALFVQQFGENGRGLSEDEKARFLKLNPKGDNKDPGAFSWLPTYAKNGSLLMLATQQTYSSNKSNYSASLLYHNGAYYYYYGSQHQIPGSTYVGDNSFDVALLTNAITPDQISNDTKDVWVKMD